MQPNNRNMQSEDEYFARREGENERERDRRDVARQELEKREATRQAERDEAWLPIPAADDAKPEGRGPGIVAALSTALKALFGIRGKRRPRHV